MGRGSDWQNRGTLRARAHARTQARRHARTQPFCGFPFPGRWILGVSTLNRFPSLLNRVLHSALVSKCEAEGGEEAEEGDTVLLKLLKAQNLPFYYLQPHLVGRGLSGLLQQTGKLRLREGLPQTLTDRVHPQLVEALGSVRPCP